MTNREVVEKLRQSGHEVGVYVRKDGSIRVTSIDGVKYSPRLSQGVEAARNLLFNEGKISQKEVERQEIKSQRAVARNIRASGDTLKSQSAKFQSEFKRLQRQIKQLNKRLIKEGKKTHKGLSWYRLREYAKRAGKTPGEQLRRMKDYYGRLFSDVAPSDYVNSLIVKLGIWKAKFPELERLLHVVKVNKNFIDVYETNNTLNWAYGYVQGIPQSETLEERIAKIEATLHKPERD